MSVVAEFLSIFTLISLCTMVTYVDLKRRIIPNTLNIAVFVSGIGLAVYGGPIDWRDALIGSCFAVLVFGGLSIFYERYRGQIGLGFGDVKFLAAIAAWVGWQGLPPLLLVSSSLALLSLLLQRLCGRRIGNSHRLAFGPYLAFSGVLVWLANYRAPGLPWTI
jgi:leader peptidase (prepilin peptidase) / N-methyltransferase